MKLTLYISSFMHDDEKHVSVGIMVERGEADISACFATTTYAKRGGAFKAVFQTMSTARSLIDLLGPEVEVEPILLNYEDLSARVISEALA
jgi:hypothetical protein